MGPQSEPLRRNLWLQLEDGPEESEEDMSGIESQNHHCRTAFQSWSVIVLVVVGLLP